MNRPWDELRTAVNEAMPALRAMSDDAATVPRAPGKWSAKEVIGHLIDSAINNHGRFVRAQLNDGLRFEGYAQDDWVRVQRHGAAEWSQLIELWSMLNLHLAGVMEAATDETRERPRTDHNLQVIAFKAPDPGAPVTLGYFMHDYVEHLRHHLRQVIPA